MIIEQVTPEPGTIGTIRIYVDPTKGLVNDLIELLTEQLQTATRREKLLIDQVEAALCRAHVNIFNFNLVTPPDEGVSFSRSLWAINTRIETIKGRLALVVKQKQMIAAQLQTLTANNYVSIYKYL